MEQPVKKPRRAAHAPLPLPDQVALVLQGGGALGSYQAGVYEALHERLIEVDWVAGISIGAVNAAIIAGNPPEKRVGQLRRFWEMVSGGLPNFYLPRDEGIREAAHMAAAAAVTAFGVPGFFRPYFIPPFLAPHGSMNAISYYDTTPLLNTLNELVDWELVNHGPIRLSVGAVNIVTGNLVYFDNHDPHWCGKIGPMHIMASGALPPGLPPVEIDGQYYWDGGIVSNTPLSHVLDHMMGDALLFQVDLFPAEGLMPKQLTDVWSRQKDIQYSSRTRQVTDNFLRRHREHGLIRKLIRKLPSELRDDPVAKELEELNHCGAVNIVHLIYRSHAWESGARDFEFSRATMVDHWAQGGEAVDGVMCKGDLIAQNIVNGKSSAFDLDRPDHLKEKKA
ncbi:patatin-like phospholipase family protein [Rhizorhapis suberifaciens]|uniref:patatin-like phospholipase family protein n=1 Tax=Rhizorhapis suberifaciens TaxID=13656 RepID=UPI001607D47D|nr:patatin-like phospholipase family protein [Rhizorhapis suberifaciens]